MNSSFCQTARCGPPDIGKYGDKFELDSDLFTVYTYPLKLVPSGLKYGQLIARVRPDGKLDILKLQFQMPKALGIKAAAPTIRQWLTLVRLPTAAAATCLNTLDKVADTDLNGLPTGIEGRCSASTGPPSQRDVLFYVSLPD